MAALAPRPAGAPFRSAEPLKVPLPSPVEPTSCLAGASGMFPEIPCHAPWQTLANAVSAAPPLGDGGFAPGDGWSPQYAAVRAMVEAGMQEQMRLRLHELQRLPFQDDVFGSRNQAAPALAPPLLSPAPPPVRSAPVAISAALEPPLAAAPASPTPPASPPKVPSQRHAPQTLSTSLKMLEDEDAECLLIVRRISKLGFKATRSLKKYFSAFGPVVKVLLAHSTARQYNDQQFRVKRRPSNLGFIQMATSKAAQQILAHGASHEVEGILIDVHRFERHGDPIEEAAAQADEDVQSEAPRSPQKLTLQPTWSRFDRGVSDASTETGASMDLFPMGLPDDLGEEFQLA